MKNDRKRWNEKYLKKSFSTDPNPILKKYYNLAPNGRALDIAAGTGKDALFLAQKGFAVDALDISDVALQKMPQRHPNLHRICIDIDTFDIPPECYSLIFNSRFLSRRLFPFIQEGLIRGGILIFETYLDEPVATPNDRMCREYLLGENELLHAFLSLRVLFYQELKQNREGETRRMAALVAVK